MLAHGFDLLAIGPAAHVIHRKQQRPHRRDMGQHLVGLIHIGAYLGHHPQQRHAIQRADWVVGNQHHGAAAGDMLQLVIRDFTGKIEVAQRIDKIQAVEMGILFSKLLQIMFIQHPA